MKKKKIMIVDDNEGERELLILCIKKFFKSLNISGKVMPEFIEAEDGQQAWDFLTKNKIVPDLMVIDFQMPGMSGNVLIEKIKKELNLDSDIILYSGWEPANKEAERLECRFISKIGGQKRLFSLISELGLFNSY